MLSMLYSKKRSSIICNNRTDQKDMKANYQSWEVRPDDFYDQKTVSDQLRFLVQFAVLAPSSHNSQPWKFEVKEHQITIRPDMRRALPKSDINNRQLFISLGCALENILIAADYYGFATQVAYQESGATISLQSVRPEPQQEKDHLIFSIPRRHTNRNPYEDQMPGEDFLQRLKHNEMDDLSITFIKDQSQKEKIADIVSEALITAMDDRGFRDELSHYLKSNITRSNLGMPGLGFGMPILISLIAPFLIKYININRVSRKKDESLLKKHTPVFGIITTKGDDRESWIRAGQAYELIALEAEKDGMKIHPMAAAIQIGDFYKALQSVLSISLRPQVFFRVGYATKLTAHSPRMSPEDVM